MFVVRLYVMSIMNDVCVCSFLLKPCLFCEECLSFLSSLNAFVILICKTTLLVVLVLYPFFLQYGQ